MSDTKERTTEDVDKDLAGLFEIIQLQGVAIEELKEQLNKSMQLLQAIITQKGI